MSETAARKERNYKPFAAVAALLIVAAAVICLFAVPFEPSYAKLSDDSPYLAMNYYFDSDEPEYNGPSVEFGGRTYALYASLPNRYSMLGGSFGECVGYTEYYSAASRALTGMLGEISSRNESLDEETKDLITGIYGAYSDALTPENSDKAQRVITVKGTDDYLVVYHVSPLLYRKAGLIYNPMVFRAVDTKGQDIDTPAFIQKLVPDSTSFFVADQELAEYFHSN